VALVLVVAVIAMVAMVAMVAIGGVVMASGVLASASDCSSLWLVLTVC
jgi:hypothetical protein